MRPLERIARARETCSERELSPTAAHVLLLLSTYADGDGAAWPGEERLCADARRGRSVVLKALGELEEAGLITTHRRRRAVAVRVLQLSAKESAQPDVLCTPEESGLPDLKPAKTSGEPNARGPVSRTQEVRPAGLPIENPQKNPHKNGTPQPPAGGLSSELDLSSVTDPTSSKRDRDRVKAQAGIEDLVRPWAAEHLPDELDRYGLPKLARSAWAAERDRRMAERVPGHSRGPITPDLIQADYLPRRVQAVAS